MFSDYLFIDFFINLVLAIIMLGLGLSLTLNDFRNIFVHPRSLITALAIQLFIVPLIAFGIAWFSPLSPPMKAGMVIVALCASGASSNLITHLFKGNVALAISMTTINSLLTLLSIPLVATLTLRIFLGVESNISLPIPETILQIFLITVFPAAIGVFIRHKRKNFALSAEKPLKYILPVMLATVFTIKIFFGESSGGTGITFHEVLHIIPYMLLLNFMAMAAGFFGGRAIRLPFPDQFTISIEVGLHNTALALLISGTILNSPEMEKPAVVYAMFSFFTAIIFVVVIKIVFRKKLK